MEKIQIIRKILSKLEKKERVRIVDILGGVDNKNRWLHFPFVKGREECWVFKVAKELEAKGLITVQYITGRNWVCRLENEVEIPPLSSLFGGEPNEIHPLPGGWNRDEAIFMKSKEVIG
jgi:hypothetical protein